MTGVCGDCSPKVEAAIDKVLGTYSESIYQLGWKAAIEAVTDVLPGAVNEAVAEVMEPAGAHASSA